MHVFRKHSKLSHGGFASISSGIAECFSALNRTVIFEPRFQSNLPSFPSRTPFISLFSAGLFFFSRSLRLALIPYLIGSDLINFSENAIKRPPGFPPISLARIPSTSTLYSDFEAPPRPFQSKYSNERTNLHPLRRTPYSFLQSRGPPPHARYISSTREEVAEDEARRDGRWTRLGNLQTTEKQRRTYILFACKNEEKRESLRYRQEFFL